MGALELKGLFAIGIMGGVFMFAIGLVAYILTAIGLSKLGDKQGVPNAWLAWIPIAQLYVIGALIKEVNLGIIKIPNMEIVLPIGAIAVAILSWIPFIGFLIGLAFYVLMIYSLYLLFKLYVPKDAVLYTILSAIGLFFIFIFIIREKEQVV